MNNSNERQKTSILINKFKNLKNIALVSNAGTPIINDPGYCLVRLCLKIGIRVVPLPGPCAAITALSASGLPANRFCYEGFLPIKRAARINLLLKLKNEERTIILYESTHRLLKNLIDMNKIFGSHRYIVLARELTKFWENIYGNYLGELIKWINENHFRSRGEMVLIIEGNNSKKNNKIIQK